MKKKSFQMRKCSCLFILWSFPPLLVHEKLCWVITWSSQKILKKGDDLTIPATLILKRHVLVPPSKQTIPFLYTC
jgi:hypothetical protein